MTGLKPVVTAAMCFRRQEAAPLSPAAVARRLPTRRTAPAAAPKQCPVPRVGPPTGARGRRRRHTSPAAGPGRDRVADHSGIAAQRRCGRWRDHRQVIDGICGRVTERGPAPVACTAGRRGRCAVVLGHRLGCPQAAEPEFGARASGLHASRRRASRPSGRSFPQCRIPRCSRLVRSPEHDRHRIPRRRSDGCRHRQGAPCGRTGCSCPRSRTSNPSKASEHGCVHPLPPRCRCIPRGLQWLRRSERHDLTRPDRRAERRATGHTRRDHGDRRP
ncbi:hypothetical protein SHL15_9050 [Streptomyces hygroscopicus subsp. limoneus]|nr:hypothetical protein SHL15_9050 [Streptomyces hygroscopicus subsp. limoneus]